MALAVAAKAQADAEHAAATKAAADKAVADAAAAAKAKADADAAVEAERFVLASHSCFDVITLYSRRIRPSLCAVASYCDFDMI